MRKPRASCPKLSFVNIKIRSISSVVISGAVIAATTFVPVLATTKRDDGDDPGQGLGTQGAILWFVLLPMAISGIIALLVMGPGWVSTAKKSAENGFLDDPTSADSLIANKPEVAALTYE